MGTRQRMQSEQKRRNKKHTNDPQLANTKYKCQIIKAKLQGYYKLGSHHARFMNSSTSETRGIRDDITGPYGGV